MSDSAEQLACSGQVVEVPVDTAQLATAMDDGSRVLVPGSYTISVGGHQPGDAEGDAGSSGKAVSATVMVA